jgi:hypothetical protein
VCFQPMGRPGFFNLSSPGFATTLRQIALVRIFAPQIRRAFSAALSSSGRAASRATSSTYSLGSTRGRSGRRVVKTEASTGSSPRDLGRPKDLSLLVENRFPAFRLGSRLRCHRDPYRIK